MQLCPENVHLALPVAIQDPMGDGVEEEGAFGIGWIFWPRV